GTGPAPAPASGIHLPRPPSASASRLCLALPAVRDGRPAELRAPHPWARPSCGLRGRGRFRNFIAEPRKNCVARRPSPAATKIACHCKSTACPFGPAWNAACTRSGHNSVARRRELRGERRAKDGRSLETAAVLLFSAMSGAPSRPRVRLLPRRRTTERLADLRPATEPVRR